jgi:hypothetical protein
MPREVPEVAKPLLGSVGPGILENHLSKTANSSARLLMIGAVFMSNILTGLFSFS